MCVILTVLFLADCEPHPHPDAGAHHGQCCVPSDPQVWSELLVSPATTVGWLWKQRCS